MPKKPTKLTIRAYQVGFGDCFLLTWVYPDRDRHVLIDFGSNGKPKNAPADMLKVVARDIEATTQGKLDAVVVTHRHKDHMSGFATNAKGTGPGDIIRSLKPTVVVQPWTEDPDAEKDAQQATTNIAQGLSLANVNDKVAAVGMLLGMQAVSEGIVVEAERLRASEQPGIRQRRFAHLAFHGEEGIKNASAVNNLRTMGKRRAYVSHGSKSGLEALLPGVKVTVLGPPTLKQSSAIRSQRHKDAAEFWMLQGFAGRHLATGAKRLFPGAQVHRGKRLPEYARWFIPKMRDIRTSILLGIVRILDGALNNTSVILLFEVNGKAFLFPGDAQIENWEYTLKNKALMKRLAKVDFYKVGHHGSRNATPKTLWENFAKRGPTSKKDRMKTALSTMSGKYDTSVEGEVPRATLIKALDSKTDFFTTQKLKSKKALSLDIPFDL